MIRSLRGGILVYMLGVIALLSIVVTEFLMETAGAIRYRSQITNREDLKIIACSALETTVAVLGQIKAIDKGLYSPDQGWGNPLEYAKFQIPEDYSISIKIRDETGKLSIYEDNLDIFGDLMGEIGFSFDEVLNLKSGLKKWLATSNEAPRDLTHKAKEKASKQVVESTKAQRIIYNLLQLKEIPAFERAFFDLKGNPNEKFEALNESISILHDFPVNINTAPDIVKKVMLGGLGLGLVAQEKKIYKSISDFGIEGNIAKELKDRFGFKARVWEVGIEVTRGPVKYYLNAIVGDIGEAESKNASRNKGSFVFLALTEGSSLIN